jgi:hypothetical protein
MARYGRGQPPPPLFLRGAAAAAVVAATLAPQIHVISLAADRRALPQERRASVTYLRPSRTSLVPDRLPRQITLVLAGTTTPSWRHPARDADVLFLRNPQAPVAAPAAAAPKPSIVLAARATAARHPARDADITFLRNPLAPAVVAPPAPQIHITGQASNRARFPSPRKGAVVVVRPSRTALVPDRLAPQIHVVSVLELRTSLPGRRAQILVLRTAAAPPPPSTTLAPQSHILLQPRERAIPRGGVLLLRAPLIAAAPAVSRIHVVSLVPARTPPLRIRRARVSFVRPSVTSLVPVRLAPQIHILLQRRGTPRTHIVLLRGAPGAGIVTPLRLTYWQQIDSDSLAVDAGRDSLGDIVISSTPVATIAVFTTDLA